MKVSESNIVRLHQAVAANTLAGAAAGRAAVTRLRHLVESIKHPWILDFGGIELVTASAFREAILPIVGLAAQDGMPCLLANVDDITREEGLLAASQAQVVLIFCSLDGDTLHSAHARGPLDTKLQTTMDLLIRLGEADARMIKEASGEETVTTAWNNRLVALTRLGLLSERKVGKTKLYSPAVKGMSYGK